MGSNGDRKQKEDIGTNYQWKDRRENPMQMKIQDESRMLCIMITT